MNCKHEFYPAIKPWSPECKHCGLLKTTIEAIEKPEKLNLCCYKCKISDISGAVSECNNPNCYCHKPNESSMEWRENVHSTVRLALNLKESEGIPQLLVNAIDAAYVAGLEATYSDGEKITDKINNIK